VQVTKGCGCTRGCGARFFRAVIIGIVGVIFFMIIPAVIFANIEPWTYAEALYFTFITVMTIGFGDLVPSYTDVSWMSENYRNWYRLAIAFWILLLTAWFAGILVSLQSTLAEAATDFEEKMVSPISKRHTTADVVTSAPELNQVRNQAYMNNNVDFNNSPAVGASYPVSNPSPAADPVGSRIVETEGMVTRLSV